MLKTKSDPAGNITGTDRAYGVQHHSGRQPIESLENPFVDWLVKNQVGFVAFMSILLIGVAVASVMLGRL